MVLQTWAAHPSNRNDYAILDPNNWDNVPEPLVSKDIFLQNTTQIAKVRTQTVAYIETDCPWNA
jgi:hypothetical protein